MKPSFALRKRGRPKTGDTTPPPPVIPETSTLAPISMLWIEHDLKARAIERKAAKARALADRFADWKPQPVGRRSMRTAKEKLRLDSIICERFYSWLREQLKCETSPLYVDASVDAFEFVWRSAWEAAKTQVESSHITEHEND